MLAADYRELQEPPWRRVVSYIESSTRYAVCCRFNHNIRESDPLMARKYEINFDDSSTQTFEASHVKTEGEWLVFHDGVGEVNRVRAAEVSCVNRVGLPERTSPNSKAA
jgi:hypothetical protein